jgi:hypothetical protein
MDQWWKRHSNIDASDYEKSNFEDITGRIPLLLDKCVVNEKIDLTVSDLSDIYDKAVEFVLQIIEKTRDSPRWLWYVRLIRRSGHY